MAELAAAYVQIIPSMKGVSAAIKKELSVPMDKASRDIGSKLSSGIGESLKALANTGVFKSFQAGWSGAATAAQSKLAGFAQDAGTRVRQVVQIGEKSASAFSSAFRNSAAETSKTLGVFTSKISGKLTAPFTKLGSTITASLTPKLARGMAVAGMLMQGTFERGAAAATAGLSKIMGVAGTAAGKVAGPFAGAFSKIRSAAGGLSKIFGPLHSAASNAASAVTRTIGGAFKAAASVAAASLAAIGAAIGTHIGSAISRVDALNQFPKVMQNMGFSASESKAAIVQLSKGIEGLPTTLDEIAVSAKGFAAFSDSAQSATDIALALNDAFLAGGASTADVSRGMAQITQMFNSGKVDLMSWRTLMETMPGPLKQLSQQLLGSGADAQQLYDALQSGQVSMDDFRSAIVTMDQQGGAGFKSFHDQALDATGGIRVAFQNVGTAITRNIGNIINAIGAEKFVAVATKMRDIVNSVGQAISSALAGGALSDSGSMIGGLIAGFGALLPLISQFATQIPFVGQLFPAISGPVGVMIGLIGAMIATSDSLRSALSGAFQAIGQAVQTLAPVFQQVFGVVTQVAGQLGDALAPVITMISGVLVQAVQMLTPFISQLVGTLGSMVSSIIPVLASTIQALMPPLMQIAQAILPVVQAVLTALMPVIGQVAAIIGQITAAVAPLIVQLAQMLVPIIQALLPVVQAVLTSIMGVLQPALAAIQAVISTVMALIKGDWEGVWNGIQALVGGVLGALIGVITGALDIVLSIFGTSWDSVKTTVQNAWENLITTVGNGITAVVNFVKELPGKAVSALASLGSSIKNVAVNAWNLFKVAVSDGISNAVSLVTSLPGKILSVLGNLGSLLVDSGRSLLEGLWNGISGAVGWVKDKISGALSTIRNLFPFSPAKEGPFSGKGWVLYSGLSIGEAMAEGISKSAPQAVKAASLMNALTQEALDQVTAALPQANMSGTSPHLYEGGSVYGQERINITVNVRPEDLAGLQYVEEFVTMLRRQTVMQGV